MPIYRLSSQLTVGELEDLPFSQAVVRSTWRKLADTATITLPNHGRVRSQQARQALAPGTRVTLQLGYNDQLLTRFEGYVKTVSTGHPLVLECQDASWLLNHGRVNRHFAKEAKLPEVLAEVVADANAPLFLGDIANITVGPYTARDVRPIDLLNDLNRAYRLDTHIEPGTFRLNAGYRYSRSSVATHDIDIQRQVRNYNDLTYRTTDSQPLLVRAVNFLPGGETQTARFGNPGGQEVKLEYMDTTNFSQFAKNYYEEHGGGGYVGSIDLFGLPRVDHGDRLNLLDSRHPDRQGVYHAEAVGIIYSENQGYTQRVQLGLQLS